MKALILAGGEGKRFGDLSKIRNKCMTIIKGKPLIEYSLDLAAASTVSEIIVVVGHKADGIIASYKNKYKGKPLKYVFQSERKGLVHAIECAKKAIGKEDFMLMLGDELMRNPKHAEMIKKYNKEKPFGICGVMKVRDLNLIRKNYSVFHAKENIIGALIEKPDKPITNIMGTGNCIFKNEIFSYIPQTPINPKRGEKELPALIQCAINEGKLVKSFSICNSYINVNFKGDIREAELHFG